MAILVHVRNRHLVAAQNGTFDVELFSDGATSDGSFTKLTTPGFTNDTFTYNINKTAAQLANLELLVTLNEPTTDNDAVFEIEVEIILTSSSSSSSFSSCSSSSSSSCSSSSCDSAFSSSSSSSCSSSRSSSSAAFIVTLDPDGDFSQTWTLNGQPTGWQCINDWDDGIPTRRFDSIFTSSANTEITDFENPVYGGTCDSIDVKIDAIGSVGDESFGVSLYDGAVQIGSERIINVTAAWVEYTENFVTSKTAAELSDLRVHYRWISGSSNVVIAASQVDIKFSSFSSSSSSSSCSSSSSSSCDSAFSSSSSSSSQSFSSSSSASGTWVAHFANDSTGWQCSSNCSSSPPWTVAGPGMVITEQGTWTDSYRPLKIRISATHNLGGNWNLDLLDTNNNTIASLAVPNGGSDTANIDWSNNLDIDDIVDQDAPTGQITNIEFFEVS